MELKKNNVQLIKEVPWGVLAWRMPDGSFVADDEGHFWLLASMEGDQERMRIMRDSVASEFGITEGEPFFFSGNRIISDEEYAHQKQRLEWGLTPDPLDIASIEEDRRNARRRR